ncbi:uncharacterized protein LOC127848763 [Dreissena polymorpha]|uniref:uncharacterized protein LOC127848763 n=1 Tax=Dreissena polymorpha TaxID=45954 RepID=UPI002264B647|nr:uncharacterized protein LOC127848763 [Dreissena polymorpha]
MMDDPLCLMNIIRVIASWVLIASPLCDLNLPNINRDDTSTDRGPGDFSYDFVECVRDSFWYQHVHEPTRGRGDADSSLLDVVFSNEEGMINSVSIENPLGNSDHSVIIFNFSGYSENHHAKERLNFGKADFDGMKETHSIDWESAMRNKTIDEQWKKETR